MKKIILILFLLATMQSVFAQRISTGFTLSTPILHTTTLPDNYLFPTNSYFIYYTGNDKKDDKPIYNQYFNGLSGGLNLNVDYKRWMLTTEVLGSQTNIRLPVLYLSYLGSLLEDNWSTMEVQNTSLQVNLLLNARLSTRSNGAFALVGFQFAQNSYKEKSDDLEADISTALSLWISDYEMYEILYTNDINQLNSIIGLGFKYRDTYSSIRYTLPLTSSTTQPLANYFRLDATHSRTLNFQKLRKGHKIYVE
jgi:hypothetical protein